MFMLPRLAFTDIIKYKKNTSDNSVFFVFLSPSQYIYTQLQLFGLNHSQGIYVEKQFF